MRTATTEIVCEGRVLILEVLLTNFALQVRKKGKGPPAKKAKKGSGPVRAKQSSTKGSRQKKSLSMLPAMPLDVLFEVKKKVLSAADPLSPSIEFIRFSRTSLPRTSSTFQEQVDFSGILS